MGKITNRFKKEVQFNLNGINFQVILLDKFEFLFSFICCWDYICLWYINNAKITIIIFWQIQTGFWDQWEDTAQLLNSCIPSHPRLDCSWSSEWEVETWWCGQGYSRTEQEVFFFTFVYTQWSKTVYLKNIRDQVLEMPKLIFTQKCECYVLCKEQRKLLAL